MNKPYIILRETHRMVLTDNGLYNGYVAVPIGHPWFGKSCDDLMHLDVHGGITYSETESDEWHVVGFDTCHHLDTASEWDVQAVAKEAESLLKQAQAMPQARPAPESDQQFNDLGYRYCYETLRMVCDNTLSWENDNNNN